MIPKWLTDSIYAKRHFNAGDVELSIQSGKLAWRFDVDAATVPISSHRVEFKFPEQHQTDIYRSIGKFYIPSWCDFTLGSAVIMQWHGPSGSGDYITIQIVDGGDNLVIYENRSDKEIADSLVKIELTRNKWINIDVEYQWSIPDTGGHGRFSGELDGVSFEATGVRYENMYQKYGCYRNGYIEGEYPAVNVWWTECETYRERLS